MQEAELLCATPGRLRLRWQALGEGETTSAVLAAMADLLGVTDVNVSTPRRRLLVRFDPAVTSLTRLFEILADLGAVITHQASPTAGRDGTRDGRRPRGSQPLSAPLMAEPPRTLGASGPAPADGRAVPRPVGSGD